VISQRWKKVNSGQIRHSKQLPRRLTVEAIEYETSGTVGEGRGESHCAADQPSPTEDGHRRGIQTVLHGAPDWGVHEVSRSGGSGCEMAAEGLDMVG
jgi:hypothetical protein